jgi:hypothetical protein
VLLHAGLQKGGRRNPVLAATSHDCHLVTLIASEPEPM